jgi:hypothetical protein
MVTPAKQLPLIPPKAPNLNVAPNDYSSQFENLLLNNLRLYFNELDNFDTGINNVINNTNGGAVLNFPGIAAYYYPAQYASGDNTASVVTWNATSNLNGFTLNADNTATALYAATYKITYSLQFANSDNSAHDAIVWLRVNGIDVPFSTTIFTVGARKSAGVYTYVTGYSEVVFNLNVGDKVGLWWGTDLHATSGGATGIWIYSRAAQTTPMAYPATPSAIGSITFLSSL